MKIWVMIAHPYTSCSTF